jgi:hypothetical protein
LDLFGDVRVGAQGGEGDAGRHFDCSWTSGGGGFASWLRNCKMPGLDRSCVRDWAFGSGEEVDGSRRGKEAGIYGGHEGGRRPARSFLEFKTVPAQVGWKDGCRSISWRPVQGALEGPWQVPSALGHGNCRSATHFGMAAVGAGPFRCHGSHRVTPCPSTGWGYPAHSHTRSGNSGLGLGSNPDSALPHQP